MKRVHVIGGFVGAILIVTVIVLVVYFSRSNAIDESKYKVVIDNDGGADDAVAVFLALLYERYFNGPTLLSLTTTHGNVLEDQCSINNQKFLKIAQRQDVPLYRGATEALVDPILPTGDYFGSDGLGDSNETFTDLVPPKDGFAVNKLIEYSKKYEGELVVIAIGPVTNIALAMKSDTNFLSRLKHLYVGGGNIKGENHLEPEFNAKMDVEAFRVIMNNATPDLVTILPFSQTEIFLNISKEWRENVFGTIDSDIVRHLNIFERIALKNSDMWYGLDPALVACVLKEDLVSEIKYSKQNIELCGEERGMTTNEFVTEAKDANVRLIYSVDKEAYKNFLLDIFSAEKPQA